MTFRGKVVLWYTAILIVTLLVFRVGIMEIVKGSLYGDLDESLRAEAAWVRDVVHGHRERGIPEAEIVEEVARRSRLSPRKEFIEIYDVDGREYFRSPNLANSLRTLVDPDLEDPITAVDSTGHRLRLFALRDAESEVYVGYPLTDVDTAVDKVAVSFVWLVPLALLLAGAGGALLVTIFVRPVRSLDRYAEQLLDLPLDRELPPPDIAARDEIARLVSRIHHIVSRMRESIRRTLGFSSLASHELRTPLAVVRSQLEESLRPGADVEELRRTAASVYDEVLRLDRVVDDLLSLATLQARTFRLERERIDLATFLNDWAREAGPLCEGRGVEFGLSTEDRAVVVADPLRLRQVLFNLLDNALRHTPRDGGVAVRQRIDGGETVIAFADTGEGIPPDIRSRLFEPFYRPTGSGRRGGAGLGLALVRWLVEIHGGSIEVDSEPGVGTTFTIRLPLAESGR